MKVLKKKWEKVSSVMFFLSCNKWKSFLGFLVSSSHSFYMWDIFHFSDFFPLFNFCVCWGPVISYILLKKRLIGALKVARNLFKEIFYINFMSLALHTSLDILMLVLRQGVEFFFFNVKRRRRKSFNLR